MSVRKEEKTEVPIASLIDVVFLLIMFFVVTAAIDKESYDQNVRLAECKYIKPVVKIPKRKIVINVRKEGVISVGMAVMSAEQLGSMLKKHVSKNGDDYIVVIRGHQDTPYSNVDAVIMAVASAKLYKIRLAAERR